MKIRTELEAAGFVHLTDFEMSADDYHIKRWASSRPCLFPHLVADQSQLPADQQTRCPKCGTIIPR